MNDPEQIDAYPRHPLDHWQRIEVRVDGTGERKVERRTFFGQGHVDDLVARFRATRRACMLQSSWISESSGKTFLAQAINRPRTGSKSSQRPGVKPTMAHW